MTQQTQEQKIDEILKGYEFSVDNLKPGEHFSFKTLSPAMLDSIVESLTEIVTEAKIAELKKLINQDRYTNRDSYAQKRISELKALKREAS